MSQGPGRNDPCPCGSGKKYKNCCLLKKQAKPTSLKGRITAKVLSAGGINKQPQSQEMDEAQAKAALDYNTLMERSFGEALHSHDDKPPSISSDYVESDEPGKEKSH